MQQTNWCISYGFGGWYILQALYEVMNSLSFYAVTVKNVKPWRMPGRLEEGIKIKHIVHISYTYSASNFVPYV